MKSFAALRFHNNNGLKRDYSLLKRFYCNKAREKPEWGYLLFSRLQWFDLLDEKIVLLFLIRLVKKVQNVTFFFILFYFEEFSMNIRFCCLSRRCMFFFHLVFNSLCHSCEENGIPWLDWKSTLKFPQSPSSFPEQVQSTAVLSILAYPSLIVRHLEHCLCVIF